MSFQKYQHVERLGSDETDGILDGVCHVFPKIDGTNASVWIEKPVGSTEHWVICAGSRNRKLTLDNDNAGFMDWILGENKFRNFFQKYPYARLYGEWLVPHSLKTYRDDAWRRFYVFDVYSTKSGWNMNVDEPTAIPYDVYKPWLDEFQIDYIPPLAIIKNPQEEDLFRLLDKSGQFLVKDGCGNGEGIVIKNYDYVNRFGRQTWAKIITNEFKEIHHKEMGAPLVNGSLLDEERAVSDFLTSEFIQKEKHKIMVEKASEAFGGERSIDYERDLIFTNKMIPELLGRVYYEFIREEMWSVVKKYKNPKINFRLLQSLVTKRVKQEIGL